MAQHRRTAKNTNQPARRQDPSHAILHPLKFPSPSLVSVLLFVTLSTVVTEPSSTVKLERGRRGRVAERDGIHRGGVGVRMVEIRSGGASSREELPVRPNRATTHVVFASQGLSRG